MIVGIKLKDSLIRSYNHSYKNRLKMSKKFTCENCLFYMEKKTQSVSKFGTCQKSKKDVMYYQNKCIDYHFVEPANEVFKKPGPKQLELNL